MTPVNRFCMFILPWRALTCSLRVESTALAFSQSSSDTSAGMRLPSSLKVTHLSAGRNFCFLVNMSTISTLPPT